MDGQSVKACENDASYNLCGPAVGWTKSGIYDVRALNGVQDCMFCVWENRVLDEYLLSFLASFPTKEDRHETMKVFLYFAGSVSWAQWVDNFLSSSQLTEKFPRQKQKHRNKKILIEQNTNVPW